ncbi:D-alanyl-D-alanine carboxypeptidase family protein [Desulfurivibrio sp. D14AmB]|uniref:D-alanyl-D-alanine carboxypeptidase family protein n=1 Tax=Desulfurivibrio sp. D14AmB TaxID=3374370 RepID=UPI00376F2010
MRLVSVWQLVLVACLSVMLCGQEAAARQALATTHKSAPGATAAGAAAATGSFTLLRPADNGLVKSQPGQAGNVLLGSAAGEQLARRLSARSAVVVDARTGRLLFALNPDEPRQPASTIKVLTGLIALDSLRDSELVPTSRRAAGMPRSKIYLQQGSSYRAGDLINAILLSSANDASVALAEKIAGSERAFARLMTGKARAMGANNTVLINSNGLTASGQQSTARDLALIFHHAMQHPEFARRIGTASAQTSFGRTLNSNNRALWQINGSEGGKTGYTNAARQTYVGKFKRGNDEVLIALMGSNSMWDDVGHLVEHGFQLMGNSAVMAAATVDPAFTRRVPGSGSVALTVLSDAGKSSL